MSQDIVQQAKEELWLRGDLDYLRHDAQRIIVNKVRNRKPEARLVVNLCSRRFGKSTEGIIFALEECIRRPCTVRLIAPTIEQGLEISRDIMSKMTQDAPKGLIKPHKSEKRWTINGTSRLIIGGAKEPESNRGVEADVIIFEEPGSANSDHLEYVWGSVLAPQLLTTKGYAIFNTTPPSNLDHCLVQRFIPQASEDDVYSIYTIYDNPMLTQEDIAFAIKESGGKDTIAFRREYLCEIIPDSATLVTPAFSEEKHIINTESLAIRSGNYWLSGDIGGSRDKTALHVFGFAVTGKIVIVDECILNARTDTISIGNAMKHLIHKYQIDSSNVWIDSHGQTLTDLYKLCSLTVQLPRKQDRDSAIRALNSAFYQDEILIFKRCSHTIKNLRSGSWNEKHTDFLWTHEFGHNDALMSIVYGYRMRQSAVFKHTPQMRPEISFTRNFQPSLTSPKGAFDWRSK